MLTCILYFLIAYFLDVIIRPPRSKYDRKSNSRRSYYSGADNIDMEDYMKYGIVHEVDEDKDDELDELDEYDELEEDDDNYDDDYDDIE